MAQTHPFLILTLLSFLIWFSHAAAQTLVQQFQTFGHLCLRREGIAAVAPIGLAQTAMGHSLSKQKTNLTIKWLSVGLGDYANSAVGLMTTEADESKVLSNVKQRGVQEGA